MNSEFQNLIAYLQTYFEEDIVAALLRQRKKGERVVHRKSKFQIK